MKLVFMARERILSESPPSRGAWIEISAAIWNAAISIVAPLAGGVD